MEEKGSGWVLTKEKDFYNRQMLGPVQRHLHAKFLTSRDLWRTQMLDSLFLARKTKLLKKQLDKSYSNTNLYK